MPQSEPQPEPQPEPRPEVRPEPQLRPEAQPWPEPEQRPEPQPEPRPEARPQFGPEPQPEPQPRPEPSPEPSPGSTPAGPPEGAPASTLDSPTTALRVSLDDPTRTLRQQIADTGSVEAPPSQESPPRPESPQSPQESAWRAEPPAPVSPPWAAAPEAERTRATPSWTPPPPSPGPGQAPAPSPDEFPETTSEAMEVLATLNRRPASALRSAAKRISIWGGLLCVLLAVLAVVQVLRPLPSPDLKLTSASNYAFSGSAPVLAWPASGQATAEVNGLGSLGHTGSDNPVPIASVTKVMTAHLILKDHPLKTGEQGPLITVDKQAQQEYQASATSGESSAKVTTGEQISEYEALQMLLIPSANNIARLLGRWDAGSDPAFIAKMQAEATALGMSKSTYTDPSGLEGTTKSTANDQLKLAEAVMLDPVFREIVSTPSFTPPGDKITYNNNALLGTNGVIGVKTGSSTAALGCLMWAAEKKIGGTTQTVLGVVLSQPAVNGVGYLPMVLANSKKVIVSAEAALQSHRIAAKGDVVGYVDDGLGGKVPVVVSQDVTVAGWGGLSVDMSLVKPTGGLPHTAKAGTTVGTLMVGTGPTAQQIPVTLQSDLVTPSYQSRLTRLG
ncbi:D-alanyl-D-alanine carboxypeptidase [Streptacidiphilus sp. PAMC 29251]